MVIIKSVGFEVLTAASMKMAVLRVVAQILPDYTALPPRRQPSS
jgi:hypothetical protein